jgi:hypothetical protein
VRPGVLVVIVLAAAAAGAVIALAVHAYASPGAGAAASSQPSVRVTGPPGSQSGGGALPGSALPGSASGGAGRLFVVGKVTAVSGTSITIGGPAHTVTADVTAATRVTGRVSGIGGVRTGDQVSAQITRAGGRDTAVAIQDPARSPLGGILP